MKKTSLLILLVSIIMLTSTCLRAQSYQTAVGVKLGEYENGLSIKYFSQKDVALEGILGFRSHGFVFTGLYEVHKTAFSVSALNFYYGIGAHLGSTDGVYQRYISDGQDFNNKTFLFGADAVLGFEYKINNAPIAISVDMNPRLELAGPFFDLAPGLGLKYTF